MYYIFKDPPERSSGNLIFFIFDLERMKQGETPIYTCKFSLSEDFSRISKIYISSTYTRSTQALSLFATNRFCFYLSL